MAQNVQYNLNFAANTTSAKAAIQDLYKSLDEVSKINLDSSSLYPDLEKGASAARMLKSYLEQAVNTNTGKLNLNELSRSLKTGGTSLKQLSTDLISCGPSGEKAFSQIVNAIAKTEVPLKKSNTLLTNFATTLKNTAKWQISSNIIHGLQGGLTSAIGYAKDLNTALTDIRIVTGKSSEEMASFASNATSAAKALSSTTKEYAKAALIYYQQGDSEDLVNEKAAITLKATNASTESTSQEMSQYLTAVWNSYQVGETQLESTIDVMAALGAKTATSMEEIAAAMEKVASVGNSVGVKFTQLSSIIATVSSVTRQSAESIGTSYKTILARIADLKLGKTDEDGVGLGVVSSQLDSLGIHILDTTGELRDMGTVIEEIGTKWQGMSKSTQTALAQAVAGKRQYTQLVALFDNWDMYQTNTGIAENSEGALQKMQDIYAESWDAASQRVQTSLEGIYNKLIDTKGIISLLNVIGDLTDGAGTLVDSFGGLTGILINIGAVGAYVFKEQIGANINSAISKLSSIKGIFSGGKNSEQTQYLQNLRDVNSVAADLASQSGVQANPQMQAEIKMSQDLLTAKENLIRNAKSLTSTQVSGFETTIKYLATELTQVQGLNAAYLKLKASSKTISSDATQAAIQAVAANSKVTTAEATRHLNSGAQQAVASGSLTGAGIPQTEAAATSIKSLMMSFQGIQEQATALGMVQEHLVAIGNSASGAVSSTELLSQAFTKLEPLLKEAGVGATAIDALKVALTGANPNAGAAFQAAAQEISALTVKSQLLQDVFTKLNIPPAIAGAIIDELANVSAAHANATVAAANQEEALKKLNAQMEAAGKQKGQTIAGIFQKGTVALMGFSNAMSGASTVIDTFSKSTSTAAEKTSSAIGVITSLAMAFSMGGGWGLAAATLGALVGILQGLETAAKNAEKASSDALTKKLQDIEDESKATTDLLVNFEELLTKKREGADVDKELIEAADKLSKAYDGTGVAVANLTGDYDDLIDKIREQQEVAAKADLETAKNNFDTAKTELANAGDTWSNRKSGWSVGSIDVSNIAQAQNLGQLPNYSTKQTNDALDAIISRLNAEGYNGISKANTQESDLANSYIVDQQLLFDYIDTQTSARDFTAARTDVNENYRNTQFGGQDVSLSDIVDKVGASDLFATSLGDTGAQLLLSENDSADYKLSTYDTITKLLEELSQAGLASTKFGTQLQQVITDMTPSIDNYKKAQEELLTAQGKGYTAKFTGATSQDQQSDHYMKFSDFTSLKSGMEKTYVGQGKSADETEAIIQTILGSNADMLEYNQIYNAFVEKFGEKAKDQTFIASLSAKIESYGTEIFQQQSLWNQLALSGVDGWDEIITAYGEVNDALIEVNQSQDVYDKATAVKAKLKKNMSSDEIQKLQDSADWQEDFGISFADFLAKDYQDQVAFIDRKSREALTKKRDKLLSIRSNQNDSVDTFSTGDNAIFTKDTNIASPLEAERNQWVNKLTDEGTDAAEKLSIVSDLLEKGSDHIAQLGWSADDITAFQTALIEVIQTGDDLAVAEYQLATAATNAAESLNSIATLKGDSALKEGDIGRKQAIVDLAQTSLKDNGDLSGLNQYAQDYLIAALKELFPDLTEIGQVSDEKLAEYETILGQELDNLYQTSSRFVQSVAAGFTQDSDTGNYKRTFQAPELANDSNLKQWVDDNNGVYDNSGAVTVTLSPESYNEVQQLVQDTALKVNNGTTAEQTTVQSNLDVTTSRQEAISQGLSAKSAAEQVEAANAIREAYMGADQETQQWAEDMAKAVENGEDLTETNRRLTTANLSVAKSVGKMNDSQYAQYKQMLKTNGVSVDGYKTLDKYFEALDTYRNQYKKLTGDTKKYQSAVEHLSGAHKETFGKLQDGISDVNEFSDALDDAETQEEKTAAATMGIGEAVQKVTTDFAGDSENDTMMNALASLFYDENGQLDAASQAAATAIWEACGFTSDQAKSAYDWLATNCTTYANLGTIDWGTILPEIGLNADQINAWIDTYNSVASLINSFSSIIGITLPIMPHVSGLTTGATAKPTGSSHGSGGSGNGGGGSGSKTKKEKLRTEDEVERYHEVEQALDRVGEKLDKIDKMKERTYGKKHIAQIDAEIAALQEEIDVQEQYLSEANSYAAADKADVTALGATFDENGNINNYDEVMGSALDTYNAAIERFNNSAQGDGDQARLDAAQQAYEDAKTAIDNYEESLAQAAESEEALLDLQNQISQLALEKITYKVEIQTTLNDSDLQILEYFQKKYEEVLGSQDEMMSSLMASASEYEDNLSVINSAIATLNAQYAAGTINEADYVSGMEDLNGQLLDNLNNLEELNDSIKEVYGNTLSQATSDLEAQTNQMTRMTTAMQSYITLLGLMGHGTNYEELQQFYDAQYTSNMASIQTQRAYYEQLLAQEEYFRQKRAQNGSLSETEQAQYDALEETITSVHETLMDETEQTLSTLQDAYQNTINAMFKSLDEFMAGTEGSLANLADNYSYFQETQERYVSTSKELYEVSKLNRQIEQSISDSTTVASKAALKALQAKIDKQSELNELTEYDIEMNQLEYQLALAQIALDEAKSAKDTVRLTRDENGNYAYQYTANQEKLNEAEQQYEDVLQQINELAGNRISELEQSFVDAQSKYQQAALEIASDMSLTEAERAEKLATLSQQYNETLLYIQQQYGNATEALGSNQEAVAERYGTTLSSLTASAAANVNSTIGTMIQNTQSYIDHMTAVIGPTGTAQTAWQSYITRIQSVSAAAGTSYDEMTSQIAAYATTTQQASTAASAILSTLQSTLPAVNALTSAWVAHQAQIQTTISYYERLTQQINASISAMQRLSGNSSSNSSSSSARNTSSVTQYATGGLADYTGPAWLDGSATQPELVLNSEDTENTLATVESVRKIDVATLALVADTLNNAAASMMSYLGNSFHANGVPSNDNSLEQNVEIHAEFPNATNHTEIEEAFDNLINRAAQYANRKQ